MIFFQAHANCLISMPSELQAPKTTFSLNLIASVAIIFSEWEVQIHAKLLFPVTKKIHNQYAFREKKHEFNSYKEKEVISYSGLLSSAENTK